MAHKTGLGDYQHDFEYEGEFDPWLTEFWPRLGKVLDKPIQEPITKGLLSAIYSIEVNPSNKD